MPTPRNNLFLHLKELRGTTRELRRGTVLVREGDPDDSLFLLLRGSLQAALLREGQPPLRLGNIAPGEVVGELSVLLGVPRSAHVVALRDSVVIEIRGSELERLPSPVLLELMRQMAGRQRETIQRRVTRRAPRSVVLLPASPGIAIEDLCAWIIPLARRLGQPVVKITPSDIPADLRSAGMVAPVLGQWFEEREKEGIVLLVADYEATAWTQCCLECADRVLLFGRAEASPELSPGEVALEALADELTRPSVDLLLLQQSRPYRGTARWLAPRRIQRCLHLRPTLLEDQERVMRQLLCANLGVALGGGGARGFAHIGLLRACADFGLPIDQIGGTSMGALVGGLAALELPPAEITERLRQRFVPSWRLRDSTLPIVSLDTGRRYEDRLQELFGDVQIEDLPIPYFCVSCNLTQSRSEIHRQGLLWRWISASMSYPAIAPPLVVNGEMLVDGGLLNNVPTDVIWRDGAGFVLGVDVSASDAFRLPSSYNGRPRAAEVLWARLRRSFGRAAAEEPVFPTLIDLIGRTCMLGSMLAEKSAQPLADQFLRMPVGRYRLLDFDRIDEIVAAGYAAAQSGLSPVREWYRQPAASSRVRL